MPGDLGRPSRTPVIITSHFPPYSTAWPFHSTHSIPPYLTVRDMDIDNNDGAPREPENIAHRAPKMTCRNEMEQTDDSLSCTVGRGSDAPLLHSGDREDDDTQPDQPDTKFTSLSSGTSLPLARFVYGHPAGDPFSAYTLRDSGLIRPFLVGSVVFMEQLRRQFLQSLMRQTKEDVEHDLRNIGAQFGPF
ncbi:hypothetical protein FALBO_12371 [Fusarium albosuccineum]|uniref:Uncharacterized protein n=1 Tax=Fusarium albosuccineum TaxID=1237068 RepID=A0A8H4P816_9HYPO|nr:hypothetical protein FALBO_12371 [Fusarium albosuccineum]